MIITTATMGADGTLVLKGLPYKVGEDVHVSIESIEEVKAQATPEYPLRGSSKFNNWDPFAPACPPEDWEALSDPT